jgi:hypothetical protein
MSEIHLMLIMGFDSGIAGLLVAEIKQLCSYLITRGENL